VQSKEMRKGFVYFHISQHLILGLHFSFLVHSSLFIISFSDEPWTFDFRHCSFEIAIQNRLW